MEFDFRLSRILKEPLVVVDKEFLRKLPRGLREQLDTVITRMGVASAKAQALSGPITSARKFGTSSQRLYLGAAGSNQCTGLLKVGVKNLFIRDDKGGLNEIQPLCVLDFYVHESCQRTGVGKKLFELMLQHERIHPHQLGYDRPSPKLLGFLRKHYKLTRFTPQNNNYVVFKDFFEKGGKGGGGRGRTHKGRRSRHNSLDKKEKEGLPPAGKNPTDKRVASPITGEPSQPYMRSSRSRQKLASASPRSHSRPRSRRELMRVSALQDTQEDGSSLPFQYPPPRGMSRSSRRSARGTNSAPVSAETSPVRSGSGFGQNYQNLPLEAKSESQGMHPQQPQRTAGGGGGWPDEKHQRTMGGGGGGGWPDEIQRPPPVGSSGYPDERTGGYPGPSSGTGAGSVSGSSEGKGSGPVYDKWPAEQEKYLDGAATLQPRRSRPPASFGEGYAKTGPVNSPSLPPLHGSAQRNGGGRAARRHPEYKPAYLSRPF